MSRRKPYIVTEQIGNHDLVATATDNLLGQPAVIIGRSRDGTQILMTEDEALALAGFITAQTSKVPG